MPSSLDLLVEGASPPNTARQREIAELAADIVASEGIDAITAATLATAMLDEDMITYHAIPFNDPDPVRLAIRQAAGDRVDNRYPTRIVDAITSLEGDAEDWDFAAACARLDAATEGTPAAGPLATLVDYICQQRHSDYAIVQVARYFGRNY